jgi:hypothetical protein
VGSSLYRPRGCVAYGSDRIISRILDLIYFRNASESTPVQSFEIQKLKYRAFAWYVSLLIVFAVDSAGTTSPRNTLDFVDYELLVGA